MLFVTIIIALIVVYLIQYRVYRYKAFESITYRVIVEKSEVFEDDEVYIYEELGNHKLLPLPFVKVDTETCVVIAMVIAVIIAVIMKLTDRGGFIVSFIVSYIILGIVFAGASAGAKALLIRDVEELYTPEIVKNYESEEGKKLAITECTEDGRVTAYWTWDFENGSYGRVQLIGHIGEKKSNGDITIYWDSQTVASLSEGLKWNDESWLKISDNYTKIVTDTEVEFRATD